MSNKFKVFILTNIHTILFLVGISFVDVSAFLYSKLVGFLILGLSLILISKLIDNN